MARIIFTYTPRSMHANQGDEPSYKEGYDMWLDSSSDSSIDSSMDGSFLFLGFCLPHELQDFINFYTNQGDEVFLSNPS